MSLQHFTLKRMGAAPAEPFGGRANSKCGGSPGNNSPKDLLNLGPEARMNFPDRPDGNWRWRCSEELLHGRSFHCSLELTQVSSRLDVPPPLLSRGKLVTAF
jgi:hypothetical protein